MELDVLTDADLVDRVRAGDSDAFAQLARRHHGWLVRTCRPLLAGDHHHAEDVAQECLVRLHATLVRDTRPLAVRAWLTVVARNLCIDQLRRRTPQPVEELPEVAATDTDPFDIDPALARAWSRLQPRQRQVLYHRELVGLSYDEIAVVLDVSVSAVQTLLFRARAALRREYQRAGGQMLGCGAFLFGLDRLARGHDAVPEAVAHVSSCDACAHAVHHMDRLTDLLRLGHLPAPPRPAGTWLSRLVDQLSAHAAHVGVLAEPATSAVLAAAVTLFPAALTPSQPSAPPARTDAPVTRQAQPVPAVVPPPTAQPLATSTTPVTAIATAPSPTPTAAWRYGSPSHPPASQPWPWPTKTASPDPHPWPWPWPTPSRWPVTP